MFCKSNDEHPVAKTLVRAGEAKRLLEIYLTLLPVISIFRNLLSCVMVFGKTETLVHLSKREVRLLHEPILGLMEVKE